MTAHHLARLPRQLRARASALPPDQLRAFADHIASRPDSIVKAFGVTGLCETAVDACEARIDAAFRQKAAAIKAARQEQRADVRATAVEAAERAYQLEYTTARQHAAAVVGRFRQQAQATIDADRAGGAVDEGRLARVTSSIRTAFALGRREVVGTLESLSGTPSRELRLAIGQVLNEARLAGQPHQAAAVEALHQVRGALVPQDVREAQALLADLDAIKPDVQFEPLPMEF